jgi:hypothetical protein
MASFLTLLLGALGAIVLERIVIRVRRGRTILASVLGPLDTLGRRWPHAWTGLIFLATFAYAVVSSLQLGTMRAQLQQSDKTLHLTQRAILGIAGVTEDFDKGQIELHLQNFGGLPAGRPNVRGQIWIKVGSRNEQTPTQWYEGRIEISPGLGINVPLKFSPPTPDERTRLGTAEGVFGIGATIKYDSGVDAGRESLSFCFLYRALPAPSWNTCPVSNAEDLKAGPIPTPAGD